MKKLTGLGRKKNSPLKTLIAIVKTLARPQSFKLSMQDHGLDQSLVDARLRRKRDAKTVRQFTTNNRVIYASTTQPPSPQIWHQCAQRLTVRLSKISDAGCQQNDRQELAFSKEPVRQVAEGSKWLLPKIQQTAHSSLHQTSYDNKL